MKTALVDYSGSSSDENVEIASKKRHLDGAKAKARAAKGDDDANPHEKQSAPSAKRGNLPPLPPSFLDLYATSARQSARDDPSLHGGRKRAIPHIAGNWPTHLYLECRCCAIQ